MTPDTRSPIELPRLRQESLAQQAYTELKASILAGRLGPGAPLPEVELAQALGISRTPVREALALLRSEGLVELTPNGNIVRILRPDEARELFLLRGALERLAVAEFVATHGKDADTGRIDALIQRQREAMRSEDVEEFLTADEEFHLAICHEAGLPQVGEILASLREKVRQAGLEALASKGRMKRVIAEHEAIVDGLRTGNAKGATTALGEHLDATGEALRPLTRA